MGRLTVQEIVTLDGYAATADGDVPFPGNPVAWEAIDRKNLPWLERVGVALLGATTYRLFANYWPTAASEGELIAPRLNAMRKVVLSRSLRVAPWGDYAPATIASGDPIPIVKRLKSEGDVVLWGSIGVANTLLRAGLVDELQLRVLPISVVTGRPLFEVPFRGILRSTQAFGDIAVQTYLPRGKPTSRPL